MKKNNFLYKIISYIFKISVKQKINMLAVLVLTVTPILAFSMTESRGTRDASGVTEKMADAKEEITWQDLNDAYDRATVSWLSVYGPEPFERVRPHIEWAVKAMDSMKWVNQGTRVSTAMLDARGDFAQRIHLSDTDTENISCRVQINIDDTGSSPVLRALGSKSSSIAFLAAHELAHCRFDSLSDDDRLPTQSMLMELGMPRDMANRVDIALRSPSLENGTDALFDSYDEALADAAATISLVRFEKENPGHRSGSVLDRARSLRLGMLHMSRRRKTGAESHQGGFVFDTILKSKSADMDWDMARRAAIQSVLLSNAYVSTVATLPRWWESVIKGGYEPVGSIYPTASTKLQKKWLSSATKMINFSSADQDEDIFISASSPAMFMVTLPDASSGIQSREDAERLWKKIGWFAPAENQLDTDNLKESVRSTH